MVTSTSRRKDGSGKSRSRHASPAVRLTARPDQVENELAHDEKVAVRIALRQEPQKRGDGLQAEAGARREHHAIGAGLRDLEREIAEVLVETRAPVRLHAVTRLQGGCTLPRPSAIDEAHMPAVFGRDQFHDGVTFAQAAKPQNDAVVGPLHRALYSFGNSSPMPR
jgi:hypothetical protein